MKSLEKRRTNHRRWSCDPGQTDSPGIEDVGTKLFMLAFGQTRYQASSFPIGEIKGKRIAFAAESRQTQSHAPADLVEYLKATGSATDSTLYYLFSHSSKSWLPNGKDTAVKAEVFESARATLLEFGAVASGDRASLAATYMDNRVTMAGNGKIDCDAE
ncbi:hypothetical protein CYLTODRAFT_411542 [Cylindrobasidium torrendii FP15055 ss-10]|uniref:Uncharacterized protein n=1 Tax=Cylindrobasidium torrendii FP15055 ss-10 TaxID=1314674 RepID=A0A0D7B8N1_9AGAR|nr:hypothetical protein CYLTODRAFT_411542 [Cylindrobasidium torrendii FP15055 ss-10]